MLKIGLTGGIGCGKSTVADLFHNLYDIPVIDADIIARQLVEPGQKALSLLQDTFGISIINADGGLDRSRLREIIYADEFKKKQLESILHPMVYQQMQNEVDRLDAKYCLLCIPLLLETKMTRFVDRVLVIDCPVDVQIERVKARDQLSTKEILSIISSQVSREYRLSHADDIIDNSNSNTQLAEQVKKLHNQYIF